MFFVDSYFLLHSGGVLQLEAPRTFTFLTRRETSEIWLEAYILLYDYT